MGDGGAAAGLEGAATDREIASTDVETDNLVYDLYGIMDEERKLIEEG